MRNIILLVTLFILQTLFSCINENKQSQSHSTSKNNLKNQIIAKNGKQPSVVVSTSGLIYITFGYENAIYYCKSFDKGISFTSPQLVGKLTKLALDMSSGPQLSVSNTNEVVIIASGKSGNLYSWALDKKTKKWNGPNSINDFENSALKGISSIGFVNETKLMVVWLDFRIKSPNNNDKNDQTSDLVIQSSRASIYSSFSDDGGNTWGKNQLVYSSPSGSVNVCSKPQLISKNNGEIYLMFRNNISNNRDMYVMKSVDFGKSFREPKILGDKAWNLNDCVYYGGDIALNQKGELIAFWYRKGNLFLSAKDQSEKLITAGKEGKIVVTRSGNYLAWTQNQNVMLKEPNKKHAVNLGKGLNIELKSFPNKQTVIIVWNKENEIKYKVYQPGKSK